MLTYSKELYDLLAHLRKMGILVFGGFVRDTIAEIPFSDIDCFVKNVDLNSTKSIHDIQSSLQRCPAVQNTYCSSLSDTYGRSVESVYIDTYLSYDKDKNIAHKYDDLLNTAHVRLNFISSDTLPVVADRVDFDGNSLYIDLNGVLQTTLHHDRLPIIIKNLQNKTLSLINSSISPKRIEHIKSRGYKVNNLMFL